MTTVGNRLREVLELVPDPETDDHGIGSPIAAQRIRSYLKEEYTGASFESYGKDRADPNRITGDDLVAVTLLSMEIRRGTRSGITPDMAVKIDNRSAEVGALLAGVPTDRELHTLDSDDFERWMGDGSPGDSLYRLLRTEINLPRVATSKLLARKRPQLLPVRDTVVEKALGLAGSNTWWRPWWEALRDDDELAPGLDAIRTAAGAPWLSLLRTADIAVWMSVRRQD